MVENLVLVIEVERKPTGKTTLSFSRITAGDKCVSGKSYAAGTDTDPALHHDWNTRAHVALNLACNQ